MNKLLVIAFFYFFFSSSAFTQTKVDSLLELCNTASENHKAAIYNQLSFQTRSDTAKSNQYSRMAFRLATKHKQIPELAKSIYYLAETNYYSREFSKAIPQYEKAIPIFESLKDLMKAILGHHAISLVIDTSDVECLNVYKNELLQVIVNLINNAKDAIVENHQENGEISIAVFYQDSNVVIEVSDNGGGIPETILSKISEPYFTTKSDKEGTGLGLYMSKMITQKHLQGTLEWFNQANGACFRIMIPR